MLDLAYPSAYVCFAHLGQTCVEAVFAAAVLLVVESVLAQQFVTALLQSSLAPIACIECHGVLSWGEVGVDLLCCPVSCLADLVEGFPSAAGQGGGKGVNAKTLCCVCCSEQAELETFEASAASLGLLFVASYGTLPCLMVVVCIDYLQTECLCVACAFILAYEVLFVRIDVGVAVVEYGLVCVCHHPFDDGTGAWGAAAVEENFGHRLVVRVCGFI